MLELDSKIRFYILLEAVVLGQKGDVMKPLESNLLNPKGKNDGLDERLKDDWANQGNPNTPMQDARKRARQDALQLAERILAEMRG